MAKLEIGTYVFKPNIAQPSADFEISFTSNSGEYVRLAAREVGLYYDNNLDEDNSATLVYSFGDSAWIDEAYCTIVIDVEQEVSDDFMQWLTANIISNTPQVNITYNGIVIATITPGQKAILKCQGDNVQMLSDITVEFA